MSKTKKLNLTINCQAVYNSSIDVPEHLSFDEAISYAKQHLDDIRMGTLKYIKGSDKIDVDNCDFEE